MINLSTRVLKEVYFAERDCKVSQLKHERCLNM